MIGFQTEAAAKAKAISLSAEKLGNYFSIIAGVDGFTACVVRGSPQTLAPGQKLTWRCINGRAFPAV